MNKEQFKGTVDQVKGKIKETWGRLSAIATPPLKPMAIIK